MTFRPTTYARTPNWGRRAPALLAAGALVVALCTPAGADAKVIEKDRTDNTFYFDYEAATGTMPRQESAAFLTKNDKVQYFIYIREAGGDPGERLVGKLQLRLIPARDENNKIDWAATKRMVYDGTFTLDIDSPSQADAYVDSRTQRVVLTREKGHRRATIRFLFDLPTGTEYEAVSRFTSSS